jgi:glycerol-3-phosphate dehydrogenase subunit B
VPAADVVVVGSGLAGLTAATALARRGARALVIAKGLASTHWTAGSVDIAAPPGAATSRRGVALLARKATHPYAVLASDVPAAVAEFLSYLAEEGLQHVGDLDSPIAMAPTGIGSTRPVAIAPFAQAAALSSWEPAETLVVCGIAGFKDFWSRPVAASLARGRLWAKGANVSSNGSSPPESGPARVIAAVADLGLEGRHNLTALHIARAFDDAVWRRSAIDAIRRALDATGVGAPARLGLPAVLGLHDHAAVLEELRTATGLPVFEMPLVPPSIPGMRLHDALRSALLKAGGRIQLGESVSRFEASSRRVDAVVMPAAAREYRVRAGAVVLATGGLAGGGIIGRPDGRLEESVLDLPVEQPRRDDWFDADPFAYAGHPIDAAGIRTDNRLRPVDGRGDVVYQNVRVCGSLLAGQRWLHERCGDGVAIASAYRVATSLAADGFRPGPALPATADSTGSAVAARAHLGGDL